jgi:nickel-dependent lactate racemase
MSMDSSIAIEPFTVEFARERLTLDVRPDRLIGLDRAALPPPLADATAAIRKAMESPLDYPPLRRALTPDDHVTVVVDENLPRLPELVTAVLEHVAAAGVASAAVTLLCPPGRQKQSWIDDLPPIFEDVRLEVHDPFDRDRRAYLASTKAGRRVYLNRAAVDADQLVVLTGPRFDPVLGYGGAEGAVYPAFSDAETCRQWDATATNALPTDHARPVLREASEVSWLLGAPFYVQVIEGTGDDVVRVIGGPADTAAEGRRSLDRCWRASVAEAADLAIATITGDPKRQTIADMAKALACAARVVRPGGAIALLCDLTPELGEGFGRMRLEEEPDAALDVLRESRSADWPAALLWLKAVQHASVYLLSGLPQETAETLFTTPISQARQVQRLVDAGGAVVVLPDAHKLLVTARPFSE